MKKVMSVLLSAFILLGSVGFSSTASAAAERVTYTLTATDNGDGTVSVIVTMPKGIGVYSGKVVVAVNSADLVLVEGSVSTLVPGGMVNESYNRDGIYGAGANFASTVPISGGVALFKATYTLNTGAVIDEDDFSVPVWNLLEAGNGEINYTEANGDVFKTVMYTVSFYDGNGGLVDRQTVKRGESATAPDAPVKEGFEFTGWDTAFDCVSTSLAVNPKYVPAEYTVDFLVDGTAVSTQTVNHGEAATAPANPVKEGYVFAGWDTAFDCVKGALTVNALWTAISYRVSFVVDGTTVSTQTVNHGQAATAPAAPVKEGFAFAGWDTAFDSVKSDLTVNALWTKKVYTVRFVVDWVIVSTQTVNHGEAATAPADPVKDDHIFVGWDKVFDSVTRDLTVYAVFKTAALIGDVNLDGVVDSADAACILQYDVGLVDYIEGGNLENGDVDGNGRVDSADAVRILRYDMGFTEEL